MHLQAGNDRGGIRGGGAAADGPRPGLGVDFAGVVTAAGPGVTDLKVGDRVGVIADATGWSTFVTCDARLAAPLPESLTAEAAAAVSTAYATAWYSLHDLARISAGDRVLIHSATGGVGQTHLDLKLQATGAQKRGIEQVTSVRNAND